MMTRCLRLTLPILMAFTCVFTAPVLAKKPSKTSKVKVVNTPLVTAPICDQQNCSVVVIPDEYTSPQFYVIHQNRIIYQAESFSNASGWGSFKRITGNLLPMKSSRGQILNTLEVEYCAFVRAEGVEGGFPICQNLYLMCNTEACVLKSESGETVKNF